MNETKNKGEWSEIYAFAKILSDRVLKGADENLNPIENENYPVLKIIRNSAKINRSYDLSENNKIRIRIEEKGLTPVNYSINSSELNIAIPKILYAIKNTKGSSFSIPDATEFAQKFNAGKIKARSSQKGDIEIVVYDKVTSSPTTVEYSIKSYLGGKPTLLNASQGTNFVFQIEGFTGDIEEINTLESKSKIQDRVKHIIDQKGQFSFSNLANDVFQSNLRKIDTLMPKYLAEYLLLFSTTKLTKIDDLTKLLIEKQTLSKIAGYEVDYDELKYKIKQLLLNIALGMVPTTKWDGFIKADGGYIVVKEDGDIVCFHIYSISHLSEYLFNNTKLQNHSSTRNKFGNLYLDGNKTLFNLNLNIRFV